MPILKKKRSVVTLAAGVAAAIVIGALSAKFVLWPGRPDAGTEKLSKLAKFTESEAFLQMNSKERGDFADALLARYIAMSPEEQAQAREMFSWLRHTRAAREAFWLDWGIKRAKEFEQLGLQDQEEYVDSWLNAMEVVVGDREIRRMPDDSPMGRKIPPRSKVKIGRDMKRILTKTSAEDRPRVAKLTGAVVRRVKERYEE